MPQDHTRATTFGGRRPEDGRLEWRRSARELYNLVRAVTHPYPGAFTTLHGATLFVWKATAVEAPAHVEPGRVCALAPGGVVVGTGGGGLRLETVQLDGEAEEPAIDLARRRGLRVGDRLGDAAC
jgi:methionyl-tRNA formyltransferase